MSIIEGFWIAPAGALASDAALMPLAGLFMRVSGVVFLAPILSERFAPAQVRLVAAFALTMLISPALPLAQKSLPVGISASAAFLASEAACGLLIGFFMRGAIFSLQIAGAIISQHLSLSQLLGVGVALEQETPLSTILVMASLALLASLNGLFHIVSALIDSFAVFPIGTPPYAPDAAYLVASRAGEAFSFAFRLSAPFVILGFVYSLTLAAANRAMPQLMAAFVGAPAIIYAGLILFALSAPIMIERWADHFGASIFAPFAGAT